MSAWVFAALYAIPLTIWLLVPFNDCTGFWTGLYERHPKGACWLWGFTHIFGPRLANSDWWPEAFEKKHLR